MVIWDVVLAYLLYDRLFTKRHKTLIYSPQRGRPWQIKVTTVPTSNFVKSKFLQELITGLWVRGHL